MQTNAKIRVLLVVRWPVGGIRTFIQYVYCQFDPHKYQFIIMAPNLPEVDVMLANLSKFDIDYYKLSSSPSFVEITGAIIRLIKNKKIDIIHSHGVISAICAVLPSIYGKVPLILTSHDMINEQRFLGVKGYLTRCAMRFMLRYAKVIHSVSGDAQDNLLEYFPSLKADKKCKMIRNAINVNLFLGAETRELRKELGLLDKCTLIGFLGRFMSPKGFKYLVEAIELLIAEGQLNKIPIVVAFGEGGFIREEKIIIKNKGIEAYFRFLPFVPDVASTIKGVDMVVMPSLWETCPLLPMEALVCGTPLISSNCIGLREVVLNTPAIIVEPLNGKTLAEAIKKEMSTNSKDKFNDFVEEAAIRFSVEIASKEIEQMYEQVISNK